MPHALIPEEGVFPPKLTSLTVVFDGTYTWSKVVRHAHGAHSQRLAITIPSTLRTVEFRGNDPRAVVGDIWQSMCTSFHNAGLQYKEGSYQFTRMPANHVPEGWTRAGWAPGEFRGGALTQEGETVAIWSMRVELEPQGAQANS